jgi:hypothetical protein
VLVAYLEHLREDIVTASNAGIGRNEKLEIASACPPTRRTTSASSPWRRSAAPDSKCSRFSTSLRRRFEYAHRFRSTVTSKREYVLVYDLGGGTFDSR